MAFEGVEVSGSRNSHSSSRNNKKQPPPTSAPVSEAVSLFLQSKACHTLLNEYADKEYCSENLYFWRHVSEYRILLQDGTPEEICEHEQMMLTMYIQSSSDHVLNLSHELRVRVKQHPHNCDNWFEVQDEIAQLIRRGPYLRMAMEISSEVSDSWTTVLNITTMEEAGKLFYSLLFEIAPQLRSLFGHDVSAQAIMLAEMIDASVGLLVNLEQLLDVIVHLGARHRQYGCIPEHFRYVGEAMLAMLAEILGNKFSPKTQRCWTVVYELVSTLMIMAIAPDEINKYMIEVPSIGKELVSSEDSKADKNSDSADHVHVSVVDVADSNEGVGDFNGEEEQHSLPAEAQQRPSKCVRVLAPVLFLISAGFAAGVAVVLTR